jgi:hypothetical protein
MAIALPWLIPVSQFLPDSTGRRFNGLCTQFAAAQCLTRANGLAANPQAIIDLAFAMRDAMFARGECGENGAATVANMAKELRNRGADIAQQVNYSGDQMAFDWRSLLRAEAGNRPVLLQLARTSELASINSAARGIQYHAVAVLHKSEQGYLVADSNISANGAIQVYPMWALERASPCGLILLNMRRETMRPQTAFGAGWGQDGRAWLSPPDGNGQRYRVEGGILFAVQQLDRLSTDDMPIANIRKDSDGVWRQRWRYCEYWWKEDNTYGFAPIVERLDHELTRTSIALDAKTTALANAQAQVAAMRSDLDAAQARITELEATATESEDMKIIRAFFQLVATMQKGKTK